MDPNRTTTVNRRARQQVTKEVHLLTMQKISVYLKRNPIKAGLDRSGLVRIGGAERN